ncbi:uncharacterized protein [Nicotiana sylvestris]|uniref:uncharacterized protein n=1 Tax=Nicotiana sylvestris TaxID=4096 RepID=UPI00388C8BC8
MAPFEALYNRRYRSPIGWFEVGEAELIRPNLVHQAMEKVKMIKEKLKTAQSRQKSYSDVCRRDLEFKEGDWVVEDPSIIVLVETIKVNEELSYEEFPVAILDRQVRKLRNKEIASVNVENGNNVKRELWNVVIVAPSVDELIHVKPKIEVR